jgi:SAM-dependent methyltransferase
MSAGAGLSGDAGFGGDAGFREAQLALFRASALKQQKWRALSSAIDQLPPFHDALDLGSDNGTISWLLRERGGRWSSAELGSDAVAMIERMVGERVHELDGSRLPFESESFDLIVVIDLLEHVDDDRELLEEIARCLRPGGHLVLNVPRVTRWSVLPAVRHAIGLTDAWHGHLRPGYTRQGVESLLPPGLRVLSARSYSRFFSHSLDTLLNWGYVRSARGRVRSTPKGMIVIGGDVKKGAGRALTLLAPAMRGITRLDAAIPWSAGHMLLLTLKKESAR